MKERRVKLNKGQQRKLIIELGNKYGSVRKLAKKLGLPYSTLKNYVLEKLLLPENLFEIILKELSIKKSRLSISYLDANWGMVLGAKKGMKALEKKYPEKIAEWRRDGLRKAIEMGRHYGYLTQKKIKKPKLNEKLAEFIGVYLGDGSLNKYQLRISGDNRYDLPYFEYLRRLVLELFGIDSTIKKDRNVNTVNLVISSKNLCSFLNKDYKIKFGHKIRNRTVIPNQIMSDRNLAMSCLRGLIDTDGSVSRRGRGGSQFCIQFTSHNKRLLSQVSKIGRDIGIFTFFEKKGAGTNKWSNITKYFKNVGSSNLRHIVRFNERLAKNNIYQREVVNYYQQPFYRDLSLPFRINLAP